MNGKAVFKEIKISIIENIDEILGTFIHTESAYVLREYFYQGEISLDSDNTAIYHYSDEDYHTGSEYRMSLNNEQILSILNGEKPEFHTLQDIGKAKEEQQQLLIAKQIRDETEKITRELKELEYLKAKYAEVNK